MSDTGDASTFVCANPDCRIGETGKCVEGMEIDKCPHFGRAPQEATETSDQVNSGIGLPAGGTLSVADASKLLRAGEGRVIAVIGPTDAGKTSLIASLYDLFQDGPIAGVEFSGSLSLHELENVCHDARAASRRGTPHINRTPRGEVKFYHLDVAGDAAGDRLALLLGDRAGEEYRTAIDDVSVVTGFCEIARADSLTLLVDGERLLDVGARHNLRSDLTLMLRAMIEGGIISTRPRLAVVLTKLDLVQESRDHARVDADFARFVATVERTFAANFSVVQSFRVAASPKSDAVRRGTGVAELLTFWLDGSPVAPTVRPTMPEAARIFGRLSPLERD